MNLDDKIYNLRKKLDNSISDNESYDKIYEISLQLDELIAEYYRREAAKKESTENE